MSLQTLHMITRHDSTSSHSSNQLIQHNFLRLEQGLLCLGKWSGNTRQVSSQQEEYNTWGWKRVKKVCPPKTPKCLTFHTSSTRRRRWLWKISSFPIWSNIHGGHRGATVTVGCEFVFLATSLDWVSALFPRIMASAANVLVPGQIPTSPSSHSPDP